MPTIRNVLQEILGLFVDDGSFAFAVLLWIGIVALTFNKFHVAIATGIILTAGLCAVLVENLIRFARRSANIDHR